jgi:hypothetical protein
MSNAPYKNSAAAVAASGNAVLGNFRPNVVPHHRTTLGIYR